MGTATRILFGSYEKLGRAVTAPPRTLFLALALLSLLLLIPSWVLGIASIPLNKDSTIHNVGFLHSVWPIMYGFGLPLIFALFSKLAEIICSRLEQVVKNKVIKKNGADLDPKVLFEDLQLCMRPGSRIILWLALLCAVCFIVLDTAHLVSSVRFLAHDQTYQQQHRKPYEDLDWTFAYAIGNHPEIGTPTPPWTPPNRYANLAFDVLAWSFEFVYVFLGFLWVFTYGWFLKIFADLLTKGTNQYSFYPPRAFPDLRLGLHPLGTLYNLYLSAVALFGLFAVWLRIKYIVINCSRNYPDLASYVSDLSRFWMEQVKNKYPSWPDERLLGFHCLNQAHWVAMISYAVCIYIIVYFPIIRMKRYVSATVLQEKQQWVNEFELLEQAQQTEKAKQLKERIQALGEAEVWPNGSPAGITFLAVMAILLTATVSPGLVAFALLGLLATGAGKKLQSVWKLWQHK
jgi:hypothetical protein